MKSYKITTVIEKDEHRYYAFCPDLDGCCTQGRTIDEAMKNIREAVGLYLETLSPRERAAISHHESVTSNIVARVD
jgi:predicted RNase H-like HicB family nuclease